MPIALDGLTGFDLDLRLSAARITIASAKLGRTAVAANLRGGKLTVTIGESQAFGGILKGSIGLATASARRRFKSQLQFTDVDLEQCLGEMFGIRRLEGKGNLGFALESSGASVYDLTKRAERHRQPDEPQGRDRRPQCRAVAAAAGAPAAVGRRRFPQRQDAVRLS